MGQRLTETERLASAAARRAYMVEWRATHRIETRAKAKAKRAANAAEMRAADRQYRAAHPEQLRTTKRAYRAANADKEKAYRRSHYEQNKSKISASHLAWARANPGVVNAINVRRWAAKLRATPAWADRAAIEAVYVHAADMTRSTGIRYEVDHIVPLQGRLVCGLHVAVNLQIITKADNIRKHNHFTPHIGPLRSTCDATPT